MPSDLETVLGLLSHAFLKLEVLYVVGGSIASSIYGVPRSTNDIDILADLKQHHGSKLVPILAKDFYVDPDRVHEAIGARESFSVIHLQTMFKIDIFVKKEDPWLNEEISRRRFEQIGSEAQSFTIPVSSPEDNILHKLEWYRKGGFVSERQWSDVLGVIKVQLEHLDYDYLRRWAASMGLSEHLEKAFSQAKPELDR